MLGQSAASVTSPVHTVPSAWSTARATIVWAIANAPASGWVTLKAPSGPVVAIGASKNTAPLSVSVTSQRWRRWGARSRRIDDAPMKHFLLFYDVAPDYLTRRAGFRDAHLAKAWESHRRGELQLGGALADPIDGAVLLFRAESVAVVEEFARTDPYVVNGVVVAWRVRAWTTVVGDGAATPVRPTEGG